MKPKNPMAKMATKKDLNMPMKKDKKDDKKMIKSAVKSKKIGY